MKVGKSMDLWQYEKDLQAKGINIIGGTDEAGRGPLYGPVVAACVVLPQGFELEGLNDSKKLSKKNVIYFMIILWKTLFMVLVLFLQKKLIKSISMKQVERP